MSSDRYSSGMVNADIVGMRGLRLLAVAGSGTLLWGEDNKSNGDGSVEMPDYKQASYSPDPNATMLATNRCRPTSTIRTHNHLRRIGIGFIIMMIY